MMGLGCSSKGPSTQYLGTWDLGNSKYSTGFGEVCNYYVLWTLSVAKLKTAADAAVYDACIFLPQAAR